MSSMYTIVNPIVQSNNKTVIKSSDNMEAAQKLYGILSKNFDTNMSNFAFTIQKLNDKKHIGKGNSDDYTHYVVNEKRGIKNPDAIKLSIEQVNIRDKKILKELQTNFSNTVSEIKKLKKQELKGGGRDDDLFEDDDDLFELDDDVEDDWLYDIYSHEKYKREGSIYNWWYYPWVYRNIIPSNYVNIPTFKLKFQPYVRILSPLSLLGF